MKTPRLLLFLAVAVTYTHSAHAQTNSTWSAASGNWTDGTKWSTNPVAPINGQPLAGDTYNAILNNGGTVTLNSAVTIQGLTLSNSTLAGSGTLSATTAIWTGGTVGGGINLVVANNLSINGGSNKFVGASDSLSPTITNNGTTSLSNGGLNLSRTGGTGAAQFQNNNVFNAIDNGSIYLYNYGGTGVPSFTNAGTFNKSGAGTTTSINFGLTFSNSGTVNVDSGTLNLNGGTSSGVFSVDAGATLAFADGTNVLTAASSVTGAGNVVLSGGSIAINGSFSLTGMLTVSNSTLSGSGTVNATDAVWTASTIGGGIQIVVANTLSISGGANKFLGASDSLSPTITNNGTASLSNGGLYLSRTGGAGAALFQNNNVFNAIGNGGIYVQNYGGTGVPSFTNAGIFNKSGAGTTTSINFGLPFSNSGTVNVDSGTLSLNGGTSSGVFSVDAGSTLAFANGTTLLTAASSVTGAGNLTFSGGSIAINGGFNLTGGVSISNGTADFNVPASISTFTLTSGMLAGSGTLTATDATWSGGIVGGAINLVVANTLDISGGANKFLGASDSLSPKITNNGTTSLSNGGLYLNRTGGTAAAQFQNNNVFNATGSANIATQNFGGTGTPSFTNAGTFNKSGAGTITDIANGIAFSNTGTVNVTGGTLVLNGGGTSSGAFNVGAGATLAFANGTNVLTAASSLAGAGNLTFSADSTAINGGFGVTGGVSITSGSTDFNVAASLSSLTLTNGTLGGSGTLNATTVSWTGGYIDGTVNLIVANTLDLSGNSKNLGYSDSLSPQITNNGTASLSSGTLYINKTGGTAAAQFQNNNVFNATGSANIATQNFGGTGTPSFTNAGTFNKSGPGTSTTLESGIFFSNTGSVNVVGGTLVLNGGGTTSGTFSIAFGATLSVGGGTNVLTAASSVTGAGNLLFSGGTTAINGGFGVTGGVTLINGTTDFNVTASLSSLTLNGGTLGGSGTLNATTATWTTGSVDGAINLVVSNTLDISGGANKFLGTSDSLSPKITNNGTTSLSNGGLYLNRTGGTAAAQFQNNNVFNAAGSVNILTQNFGGTGTPTFANAGTFNKSGPGTSTTLESGIFFSNTGTVNVVGGTLTLGNVIQHKTTPLPATLTGGTWKVTDASLVFSNTTNITRNEAVVSLSGSTAVFTRFTAALNDNQGSLTLKNDRDLATAGALTNGGALRVEDAATLLTIGAGGSAAYTQTAGSTTLVGDAQIKAVSFNLQGGTFAGTGTLTGNLVSTNSPVVAPGASAGTLTIAGTANLTGTLAMEIGGLTPGSGHDQLLVGGSLNLGGNLSLAFINGFVPAHGQNIVLVDAGTTSGSFANVPSGSRVFTLNNQHSFAVHYGAGSPFGSDKVVLSAFSDIVAPVLALPANITQEATGPNTTPVSFTVSANDAVEGSVPAIATPTSGSGFTLGATTVNVTASDIGGNVANGSFKITVVDTTTPVLTLSANITAEATGPAGRVVNYAATATDIVDTSPDILSSPASGSTFPLGTTTVNVSATDDFSNVANGSFTVKIVDTTAPVLTVPANLTVKATTVAGTVVNFSVSALDLVSGSLSPTASIPSGSLFPPGTSTVNVTATDAAGNQASTSFTVQVTIEPDVFVKETSGGEIPEGTGSVAFDSATVGTSGPSKSITIRNDGTDQLVLGTITIDGVNASNFQATTPPLDTLAPGGSTTFSITFTPSAPGNRNAMIHLSSNDPDASEAIYGFALGGIGLPILPSFGSTPIITLPSASAGAKFTADVIGSPGATVKLEASTDLGMSDAWAVISQLVLDGTGNGTFTAVEDPGSAGSKRDFFRMWSVP